MSPRKIAAIGVAVLALITSGAARAQKQEELLNYGITGSESPVPGRVSYSSVIRRIEVQKLLLDIAAAPRAPEYLDTALTGTGITQEDLMSLGLVRREGKLYVINFTLLTSTDVHKVREVAETYARSLAAAFLARRTDIDAALKRYQVETVDPKAVAYVVLGCFSLDWDGLALTGEKGYRSTASSWREGATYIPYAEEKTEISLKGIYWGSHNDGEADFTFTSFGDHFSSPRYALPDLLWGLSRRAAPENLPESLKPKVVWVVRQSLLATARQTARIMFTLRRGGKNLDELAKAAGMARDKAAHLVDLLVELDYVMQDGGVYHARVPVLTKQDLPMVKELRRIGRDIMDSWLADKYDQVRTALADITPLRYGVPYPHIFTQIWHHIFGVANRQLVEAGLFADPYADSQKYKGFTPAVWHPSLTKSP